MQVGILTVSDRCFHYKAVDSSGPNLEFVVNSGSLFPGKVEKMEIVPDDFEQIQATIKHWSDDLKLSVILTTGGTGVASRDVTPEATKSIIDKEMPGMTLAMLKGSLDVTSMAMLSRAICGVRGQTLIVNLPGSKKGSEECLRFVAPAFSHAVDLLRGNKGNVEKTHGQVQHSNSAHQCSHHFDSVSKSNAQDIVHMEQNLNKPARRHRKSPYPVTPLTTAQEIVLNEATQRGTVTVNCKDALGLILGESVLAKDPLPPFAASIKDGYAVIASDGSGTRTVLGESAAGDQIGKITVTTGHCVRITTGAPIPNGADSVVQVEDTELLKEADEGSTELEIKILTSTKVGQDIRSIPTREEIQQVLTALYQTQECIGSDIQAGQVVLEVGVKLGSSELGLLASIGVTHVSVFSVPTIGVLSSGNELVEPDKDLLPGCIRDSNKTTILSLLKEQGFSGLDLGIARDDPENLTKKLKEAFDIADVLITTGGVSMGEKDFMKQILQLKFNAKICFGRVFMKPGLPTTFATAVVDNKKKFVFALPGNPVSATVTCHLFVLPALRKLMGFRNPMYTTIKAKLLSEIVLDPRPEFHRAILTTWNSSEMVPAATSTGNQISSRLLSLKSANSLLVLPPRSEKVTSLKPGELVDAIVTSY